MKQALLITLLYFSPLLWRGAGGEVSAQVVMPDPVRRDSLIKLVEKYDQQKKELGKSDYIPADTLKADLLWDIYRYDDYFSNPDKCNTRIAEIKAISQALNYKKGIANAITGEGVVFNFKQEYQKAVECHKKALTIREQINDKWGMRWSYFNLGMSYGGQFLNKEAIEWILKSIKLAEQNKDSTLLNFAYAGIASIYQATGNVTDAINFQEKAVDYLGKTNDKKDYCLAQINLSYYFILNNNLYKAKEVLNHANITAQELKNIFVFSSYYVVLGELDVKQQNYGSAILNFKLCNNLEDSINIQQNTPYNYRNIAECILKADKKQLAIAGIPESKKYDEAIRYAQKSQELTIPSNILDITSDNYLFLSTAYEAKGDMKLAYKYFKLGTEIKDSLYNAENTKTIQGLKMQYETEKKEQQIALLNKDKALQQTELSKQTTTRNAFIGGFILVALLAGVSYNRYRLKQSSNRQLSINLERLKNTQAQLVENEKLASLGQLTAGIAHEIKNPLNFVNNFSELSKDIIAELRSAKDDNERSLILKDLNENISKIKHHGNRADNIVKSMLLHSRDSSGEKTVTHINQLCEEVLNLSYKNVTLKFSKFSCNVEKIFTADLPSIICDKEEISRVILNLLDNAFYAVRARADGRASGDEYKPTVTLKTSVAAVKAVPLSPKNTIPSSFSLGEGTRRADEVGRAGEGSVSAVESITISIKDNGTGIPEKIKQKIFEPFFTTKPTHEGTGLGLSICNDIIKTHGGVMKVESKENEFTEFVISLPI